MNIEDKIYSESLKLSDAYFPYYFKKYPRNKYQVYNTYKKYFIKAASMFCIRDNYDSKKLIQAFMMDGFKYPQQLCNETIWKTYINYLPGLHEEKSKELILATDIVNSVIEIKKYGKVKDWLNVKINQKMLFEGQLKFEPIIFAFSSDFLEFYEENKDKFIIEYNIDSLRNKVFTSTISKKLDCKIREFLDQDYYTYIDELREELEHAGIIF